MTLRHAIAIVVACWAWPASAGTPIQLTRDLAPLGRLEVSNVQGSVQVRGWDRPQVTVSGELGHGARPLLVEGDADALEVHVRYPPNMRGREPTRLVLRVPFQAMLSIQTVAADVDVDGVAPQEVEIESVSGNIRLVGAPRKAGLASVSGHIGATINSADVEVESVSGDVRVSGRLGGRVDASSVSGSLLVDSLGERLRRLRLETVSGDARATVALQGDGELRAETLSGQVLLRVPADTSARVEGESFSGRLSAPGIKTVREGMGAGSTLKGVYGAGEGRIRLETFSGDATLVLDGPARK